MSSFDSDELDTPTGGDGDEEPRSMPLSAMAADDPATGVDGDFQSTKAPSKIFNQGSMLLVLIAAVAGGAIFTMRQTSSVGPGQGVDRKVEAKIEQALAKLSRPGEMSADDPLTPGNLANLNQNTDAIVAIFQDDVSARQVPLEYVQKDPFELFQPPAEIAVVTTRTGPTMEELEAQKRAAALAAREQALRAELQRMRCDAIMGDLVMINGNALRRGMKVGNFTVVDIKASSVVLRADDLSYELKINGDIESLNRLTLP